MKKHFLILIFTAAVTLPALILFGQEFEAASVKPNKSGQRGGSLPPPVGGRFTATNVSLKQLLTYAHRLQDFQLSGGPSWAGSETFDVLAKADGSASEDQVRIMLQKVLTDRFKLKMHRETRDLPIYSLAIAKNGLKMRRPASDCTPPGTLTAPCGGFRIRNRSIITGQNVPLTELIDTLSTLTGRVIVDKTGLTGRFDIHLQWSPDTTLAVPPESGVDADSPAGATLFTALREQLGLQLESKKGPVPFLVIDAAERPVAN